MQQWLEHPAVQAGVVPFAVALVVAGILRRTRAAWFAPTVAYAVAVALTSGIAFQPLTAGRKVLLTALIAPVVGLLVDRIGTRAARIVAIAAASGAAVWTFGTVLAQKSPGEAFALAAGLAAFVAAAAALALRLRDDGPAAAAAGLGLGLATGVAALLSASTGYFAAGIALAAGSGALLLLQFATAAAMPAGATGTLAVAVAASLFAAATCVLAQLPWYALPLLLAVPAIVAAPFGRTLSRRTRLVALTLAALAAAALPVLAAWVASRTMS